MIYLDNLLTLIEKVKLPEAVPKLYNKLFFSAVFFFKGVKCMR